jgi:predicted phage baseplate assembly protein
VRGVSNPLPASGAEDAEALDRARENAPFTVLTLDRIVSLRDFEDFARAFAGIGKAHATWLWAGESRLVHITVAAADGSPIDPTSLLHQNLRLAIDGARDPVQRVQVDSFIPLLFNVAAKVLVKREYLKDLVLAAVAEALRLAFGFERRAFGQAATKSEVLAAIQSVAGVEAADLDALYIVGNPASLNDVLPARIAHWDESAAAPTVRPAELLLLNRA